MVSLTGDSYDRASYRIRPEVRRAVERENLSQNQLARLCGLSSGHMSQMLTGKRCPGPVARRCLMQALNLTFDQLFEEVR